MKLGKVLAVIIASLSLLLAVSVYNFARPIPPVLFDSFHTATPVLASHIGLFGSAPSFLYTLAVGLILGLVARSRPEAGIHCLSWTGLAVCMEILQHPVCSGALTPWLMAEFPASVWSVIEPYWNHGTFDPLDLLATVAGGGIALILLRFLLAENIDAVGV